MLLTDGINTDGPSLADAAEYARRRGVPLFFVGLGSDQPVRDLKLSDLLVDDVVFVDDVVNFECKLTASGFEGRKVAVVLREKDKPAVLAKVEVTVGPDGQSQQVRLPYRPTQVGQFEFVVEVEPQEGELQTENNRQTRTVQVRKEKIRVLLVAGLSELRVPLPAQHAPARRDDRAEHRAAGGRPGTRRAGRRGAAGVSRCGARSCSPTTW